MHRRSSGNHAKRADALQVLPERIGHSVHEIFLVGIAGKICQGKYRERPDRTRKGPIANCVAYAREMNADKGQKHEPRDPGCQQSQTRSPCWFPVRLLLWGDNLRGRSDNFGGLAERSDEARSEEHTSELQSLRHLVCRLLL